MHGFVKLVSPDGRLVLVETPNGFVVLEVLDFAMLDRGDAIDGQLEERGLAKLRKRETGLEFEAFVEIASPRCGL
jgi:hypothetical protein